MLGIGFIRVKLLQCEHGESHRVPVGQTFDPFVAVNVKEAIQIQGKSHMDILHGAGHFITDLRPQKSCLFPVGCPNFFTPKTLS